MSENLAETKDENTVRGHRVPPLVYPEIQFSFSKWPSQREIRIVEISQEFNKLVQNSAYRLKKAEDKKGLQRYSDKYGEQDQTEPIEVETIETTSENTTFKKDHMRKILSIGEDNDKEKEESESDSDKESTDECADENYEYEDDYNQNYLESDDKYGEDDEW